jgi:hypothetical protein
MVRALSLSRFTPVNCLTCNIISQVGRAIYAPIFDSAWMNKLAQKNT